MCVCVFCWYECACLLFVAQCWHLQKNTGWIRGQLASDSAWFPYYYPTVAWPASHTHTFIHTDTHSPCVISALLKYILDTIAYNSLFCAFFNCLHLSSIQTQSPWRHKTPSIDVFTAICFQCSNHPFTVSECIIHGLVIINSCSRTQTIHFRELRSSLQQIAK